MSLMGDIPNRRSTDDAAALIEIRRQELSRLASIDGNNKRLAEATEALIEALNNFATKAEVDAKVEAVKDTAVRAADDRRVVIKRVTFWLVVLGVFIVMGIAATLSYALSQQHYHAAQYQNCLVRNDQTEAQRMYFQGSLQRVVAHPNPAYPPAVQAQQIKDLNTLIDNFHVVACKH